MDVAADNLRKGADMGAPGRIGGQEVVAFDLPSGTIAGYYPELNPLIALSHHDQASKTPASKAVPVRILAQH